MLTNIFLFLGGGADIDYNVLIVLFFKLIFKNIYVSFVLYSEYLRNGCRGIGECRVLDFVDVLPANIYQCLSLG